MAYADARLGKTPFTSLGITWNDKRYAHKDEDDTKLGFIIWFRKGMTSNPFIRITSLILVQILYSNINFVVLTHLHVFYFVERTNPKRSSKGGQFFLPCHKLYVQPRPGTVLLFDSAHICRSTIGSSGFKQIGIALFTKKNYLQYRETLRAHEVKYEVNMRLLRVIILNCIQKEQGKLDRYLKITGVY
jgi:hypothetical protein